MADRRMKPERDAYGQEVWDYFNGRDGNEIVEREDGYFGTSGGPKAYFKEYKDWITEEKRAIRLARGRILDIGCGAGRHSLYLQGKGHDVTGIDNSPLAIKVCKKRGLKKARVLPIEEIGTFKENSFDSVIMLGNNFGLFGNFSKARKLLKVLYRITSPKARIIAESLDPYNTNNPVHKEYHKLNKKRGKMAGQLKMRIRFERTVGEWFEYLLVSKKEMESILEGTGWRIKRFFKGDHWNTYVIEKS